MDVTLLKEIIRKLQKYLLRVICEVVEPMEWQELNASFSEIYDIENSQSPEDKAIKGIYHILIDDLPVIRDFKALFNMFSLMVSIIEQRQEKYSLMGASVAAQVNILRDFNDYRYYYNIYQSTNSILTHYLALFEQFSVDVIIPRAVQKIKILVNHITVENFDKVFELSMDKLIALDKFQENFSRQNQFALSQKNPALEKKEEKHDDFITTLVRTNDYYLKEFYKEDYKKNFVIEEKGLVLVRGLGQSAFDGRLVDYYPEKEEDSGVTKNLKFLLNGIIGIKKVLDDHAAYQTSGIFESVTIVPSFIRNLSRVYYSLTAFDYQAVIAEKSTPFMTDLKAALKKVNVLFEKLACVADQFELEMRLKEGVLLNRIAIFVERYNQMMSELRIENDYTKQRHIYLNARMNARVRILDEIDAQLVHLFMFIRWKSQALNKIPLEVISSIQRYIEKYNDVICVNRKHLKRYTDYLHDRVKPGSSESTVKVFYKYVKNQLEFIANCFGVTLHAEVMDEFEKRMHYLLKQKQYIESKIQSTAKKYHDQPFVFFSKSEVESKDRNDAIVNVLRNRYDEIGLEQKQVVKKAVFVTAQIATLVGSEAAFDEYKIDFDKTKARIENQIKLKAREYSIFNTLIIKVALNEPVELDEVVKTEPGLSPKSMRILDEIRDIVAVTR